MNILIPMAGAGSRFAEKGYKLPKPLIDVAGEPMIKRCLDSLGMKGQHIFIIRTYENREHYKQLRHVLEQATKEPIIIEIDQLTEGAACTCLLAKEYINNDEPLISVNCDQIMEWDASHFMNHITESDIDGCVVTYDSDSIKNSYIELDENGLGVRLAEKDPISKHSLTGVHYWTKGRFFVESAESMIEQNIRINNEFYVAPTYNEMIKQGQKVTNYHISKSHFYPVGTPDDLQKYLDTKKLVTICGHTFYNKPDSDSLVIDLGANRGIFSEGIIEKYDCTVIAYEPSRLLCDKQLKGLAERYSNFSYEQKAVWSEDSTMTLSDFCDKNGNTSGVANTLMSHKKDKRRDGRYIREKYEVQCEGINKLLKNHEKVDILKVDIEGSEFEVLAKASDESLKKCNQICVEFHLFCQAEYELNITNEDLKTIVRRIESLGFKSLKTNSKHPDYLFYKD